MKIFKFLLLISFLFGVSLEVSAHFHQIPTARVIASVASSDINKDPVLTRHRYYYVLRPGYMARTRWFSGGLVSRLAFFLTFNPDAIAVTYWDNIFLKNPEDAHNVPLIAHELVHTVQYKKPLLVYHAVRYFWYYFTKGYQSVPYEQEAFEFQKSVLQAVLLAE